MWWLSDKAPFVFSVFVAALGWLVSHAADRVVASPFVEYASEREASSAAVEFRQSVELQNLSSAYAIRDIVVVLRKPHEKSDVKFSNARMEPVPPTWVGVQAPQAGVDAAEFRIRTLPPGGRVELSVEIQGKDIPVLQAHAETPFRLQRRGFLTWFVKNELCVLMGGLIAWILFIAFLLYRNRGEPYARQPRNAI